MNESPANKVLVVDDTPANLDILQKYLEREGYNVAVAPNGELALKIAPKFLPDLVLLDVMMPGINGFETCRRLRADPATKDIPVIFITAKMENEDILEGFAVGGVDYITKPFRREEMLARVRAHLHIRQLLREKEDLIAELDSAARTDPLTQLANRRHMMELLEYENTRMERHKAPCCLILCDIDHFKKINDSYGHDAGDAVLVHLAQALRNGLRKQDSVCRWGGEEFLVLLPETELSGGILLAEKLRALVESSEVIHGRTTLRATLSLGVYASGGKSDKTIEHCIRQADANLYLAKNNGRNRVVPTSA